MCFQRFCNFANVLSLQKLDIDDIIKIEQTVKEQFKNWLDQNTDTTNFVDYFGPIYHARPNEFTLSCGDEKMILQLSEYVKTTIQRKGYEYFQGQNSRCHQSTKRNRTNNYEISEEELEEQLFNGVLHLLQPYGDHVTSLFKKEMVVVTNANGEIKGNVRCVVCETEIEAGKKMKTGRNKSYSQYWNGHKWILSNFANHHLCNVHPIANSANQTHTKSEIDKENSQTKASHSISAAADLRNNSNDENLMTDERM